MAIEYFVQFACPVREQITDQQLLDMQKSRSRAISTREALRADPNVDSSRPESERTPATRAWSGGLFSRKHAVRSSQILQTFMSGASLSANETRALAWLFGYIDKDGALQSRRDNWPAEDECSGVAEMKLFMMCIAVAAATGSSMFLEP